MESSLATQHVGAPLTNGTHAKPTYTIIHAEGMWPDDTVEHEIFKSKEGQAYYVNYVQTNLAPTVTEIPKHWSAIDKSLRNQVQGIMLFRLPLTKADLDLFPKLKIVLRMGVGYDRLDRVSLAKRNITVCNIPDYGTCEIADHALALALTLRRGVALHHDMQRFTETPSWLYIPSPLIHRIQAKTFGILGLGRIGMATAMRAKAFGWDVIFYDPYLLNGVDKALGLERVKDTQELFRRSTTLSLHCPCTRETRGMIGYELLSLMPFGSILVNTARGEIVDLDGVERCLKEGNLMAVGFDVLPIEPIPKVGAHPLIQAYRNREEWLMGRMVITPHTAFYSPESYVDIRIKSAETMRDVLIDGGMLNVIRPDQE
ncbi:C-terminal binding protein [Lophiotrema nucula]|uniref:C-terminal binding protein n=1 Tax=Lophiotrema nucula TaxID=690887 RepID=A0A6A5ZWB8_9PLEO|nr:C-terminal binding protein [Lophiotrema nucula]